MKNLTLLSQKEKQSKSPEDIKVFRGEQAQREKARRRYRDFIAYTFPTYEWSWHLEMLAHLLQAFVTGENIPEIKEFGIADITQYDVLCLDFPPRHGKSEQASIRLPAWYLGNFPEREIITASYSGDLASDFGGKAREVMKDLKYQNIFDIKLAQDSKAKDKWNTEQGGGYTSTGIGGSVTGKGADVFLIDDPHKDRKEAESKIMRDAVWSFYTSVAETRMSPNGKKIVIQTRWHDDDLIGRILKREKEDPGSDRVLHINFPAIAKKKERFREIGEALWPGRWSLPLLMKKKANIGSREFGALYQGDPVDDDSSYFKRKDFRYIEEKEVEKKRTLRFLTVDSALTKKDDNCPTGFVDNRVDWENFWHIKAWRKWMTAKELMDELFVLQQIFKYDQIGVEKTLFTMALEEFYELEMRRRNVFLPLTYLEHNNVSKDIRVRGVSPRYEAHSVIHIVGQCADLEEELVRWPSGEFRDLADALAHQKDFAFAPGNEKQEKEMARQEQQVKNPFGLFPEITSDDSSDNEMFGLNL